MAMPYQNSIYHQVPQYAPQYYNPYLQQQRFQQPEPVQQVPMQPPQSMQQPVRGLNGMVVQSADRVTADCVPMDGSAAFFPKQDLSEIYVKSWNSDGTIRTLTYRPVDSMTDGQKMDSGLSGSAVEVLEKRFDELVSKINKLEESITNSMTKRPASATKKAGEQA